MTAIKIPTKVRLEAAAVCQLKCPSCSTGTGKNAAALGRGILSSDAFLSFVTNNPTVKFIELSNYGEVFLNPHLKNILRLAYERSVNITLSNGVNLNTVDDDVLGALVQFRVRHITISIDGASQKTYAQYRKGGDFDRVIRNVEKLVALKQLHKSTLPALTWQFVVFGHNEHEIHLARALAERLEMDFYVKRSWDELLSPILNVDNVRKEAGWDVVSRSEHEQRHGAPYLSSICHQLWDQPQINWDGRLLGCCANSWSDFGANAFSQGLELAVNSEKICYARQMLTGTVPSRPDIPCTSCHRYLKMKLYNRYLNRPDY